MDRKLLEKYIQNQCSPTELEQVQHWLNSPENKEEVLDMFARYWNAMPEDPSTGDVDSAKVFARIVTTIGAENSAAKAPVYISHNKATIRKSNDSRLTILKYAAAILLFITSALGIYFYTQKEAPASQKVAQERIIRKKSAIKELLLSDGSKVWLNAESTLKYPLNFSGSTREVYLEGEAFFDVVKNPDKPFIVKTSGFTIKVLGTSFNVKSYKQDETIETALATGKIYIEKPASKRSKEQTLVLQPSQGAVFYKETQAIQKLEQVDVKDNIAWREGILVFKDAPFEQVVVALERWYQIKIVHKNISKKEFRLTARFEKETLNEVLSIIKLTLPIEYTIEENKVLIR